MANHDEKNNLCFENGHMYLKIKTQVAKTWQLDFINALTQVAHHYKDTMDKDQMRFAMEQAKVSMFAPGKSSDSDTMTKAQAADLICQILKTLESAQNGIVESIEVHKYETTTMAQEKRSFAKTVNIDLVSQDQSEWVTASNR